MAKHINSKFNEAVSYFANVGLGKAKIKFQPVAKGKTWAMRECHHCTSHNAVVFRGFEDTSKYILWCPKCSKLSFPEADNGQKREAKAINKTSNRRQCKGTKVNGDPCNGAAKKGSDYCGQHQNQDPNVPDHRGSY